MRVYTEIQKARKAAATKAWALAKSPSGAIMSTLMMFYFSGSGVSIFTIMITI